MKAFSNCSFILLPMIFIGLTEPVFGFVPSKIYNNNLESKHAIMSMHMSSSPNQSTIVDRRDVMSQMKSLLILSSVLTSANVAEAKDKKDLEPVSIVTVRQSFDAVRQGLSSGYLDLGILVENEDYEQIMEFTQNYDMEFRKAKMGKARKFVTSKAEKDKAVLICNAVTFDLIGMNKGSRVGQRDINQVKKYYEEMKIDIQRFLDLEKDIDVSEYTP